MSALGEREYSKLLEGIEHVHSARTLTELMQCALETLTRMIRCDAGVFAHRDMTTATFRTAWTPTHLPLSDYGEAYENHLPEHPLMSHFLRTQSSDPKRISDVVCNADFERRGIYHEFYQPLRLNRQLGVLLRPGPRSLVGISVNRQGREFSQRDVRVLSLLRPHLSLAVRRLGLGRSAVRRPALPRTVGKGRVAFLAGPFRTAFWRAKPFEAADPTEYPESIAPADDERAEDLHRTGLTPRETEVLHWVAEGKTNPEIGIILQTSPRTVQKHVEHIFQKLGVETRTTAAVRAMELFGDARPAAPQRA